VFFLLTLDKKLRYRRATARQLRIGCVYVTAYQGTQTDRATHWTGQLYNTV